MSSTFGPSAGVLNARLWVGDSPWRLAGGWTFLAGVILSTNWSWTAGNAGTFLLALLLVEALWTAIWGQSLSLSRATASEGGAHGAPRMPYADASAPLARFWRWFHSSEEGLFGRDVWIALVLAGAVSVTLGRQAVIASVGVTLCALFASAARPALPRLSRLLYVAVAVAWPWWLGMVLWRSAAQGWWPSLAESSWLLMAAFAFLAFVAGEVKAGSLWPWLWVAHAAPVAALAAAGEYGAAVMTTAVLLTPSLQARRLAHSPGSLGRWHLVALATSVASLWLGL